MLTNDTAPSQKFKAIYCCYLNHCNLGPSQGSISIMMEYVKNHCRIMRLNQKYVNPCPPKYARPNILHFEKKNRRSIYKSAKSQLNGNIKVEPEWHDCIMIAST